MGKGRENVKGQQNMTLVEGSGYSGEGRFKKGNLKGYKVPA